MKTAPEDNIAFVITSCSPTRKPSVSAARPGTHSSSGKRAGFRPRLEPLEDRTLLSGLPYPTAATVTQLIADINYADTAGGAISVNLAPGTTFSLTSANNTTDGGNGLPVIGGTNAAALTITGNDDTIQNSVSTNGKSSSQFRLLDVVVGGSLILDNVTLKGGAATGSSGGAIYNQGMLTITGSVLSDDVASYGGGIYNAGTATVSDGTALSDNGAGYGGGIYNRGALTVQDSTLSGNTASNLYGPGTVSGYGGGICDAGGTVTISDGSALTGNTAENDHYEANFIGGFGGGIDNVGGMMTISDSTLSGNTDFGGAGGGIYNRSGGTITVENSSSITGNGSTYYSDDVASVGVLNLDSTSTIGTLNSQPTGLTISTGGECAFIYNPSSEGSTVNIISGTITIDDDLSNFYGIYDDLTIQNGANVVLQSNQQLGQLQLIGNATLDIAASTLTIDYGSNPDPLSTVAAYLQSGFNKGAWNGSGIISSSAAADPSKATGVGYFDNGSKITIAHTWYGDTTLSGEVTASDYLQIDNAFNYNQAHPSTSLTGWFNGDFNYDGVINGDDYTLIDNAYNTQGSVSFAALPASQIAINAAQIAPTSGTPSVSRAQSTAGRRVTATVANPITGNNTDSQELKKRRSSNWEILEAGPS